VKAASEALETALTAGRKLATELPDPLGNIRTAIEKLPAGHTKESLLVLADKTKRDAALVANQAASMQAQVEMFQANVERWFNDAMDRVSGWYKRWTQKVLLVIALFVVAGTNADTLTLVKRFTRDSGLRASVVAAAEKAVQDTAVNPATNVAARQDVLKSAGQLNLPLGWLTNPDDPYKTEQVPNSLPGWLLKVFGLLISVGAVSLGAPFWFDLLSKFINIRGAGTPPGEPKRSAPQVAAR
jgi:hypothetical protein